MKALVTFAAAAVVAAIAGTNPTDTTVGERPAQFDHERHQVLMSNCTTCHAGITTGGPTFPGASLCSSCHNGNVQPTVDYAPRSGPSGADLKFVHSNHPATGNCSTCHESGGAPPAIDACGQCHSLEGEHMDAANDCEMCHVSPPAPATHEWSWTQEHAVEAAASPERCATCHVRSDCLDCHRAAAASPSPGYHPADFLQRHSAWSYNRDNATSCGECHNVAQFCQSCHKQAGLTSVGAIDAGYHDAYPYFATDHAQLARQNLESCVSCHTENDCLRCHTRTNPHGPDFNAETMREKNAQMCTACHGLNVPDPD